MANFVKLDEENKEKKKIPKMVVLRGPKISFGKIILLIIAFMFINSMIISFLNEMKPKIAVISIKGTIHSGSSNFFTETTSAKSIVNQINEIKENPKFKAVIFDINSPGGSPVATEEISNKIKELDIPTYTIFRDIGASGAFWIGTTANKVYASNMSILGSIGVTSAGLGLEDFIKRYNITYRRQTSGELKDMGTPLRKQTEEEKEIIEKMLNKIHIKFINQVAQNRNMTFEEAEKYSDGRIFLGEEAITYNLIDEIGTEEDIIKEIENITKIKKLQIYDFDRNLNLRELLFSIKHNPINFLETRNLIELK